MTYDDWKLTASDDAVQLTLAHDKKHAFCDEPDEPDEPETCRECGDEATASSFVICARCWDRYYA